MDIFVKSFIGGFLGSFTGTGLIVGMLIWPVLTGKPNIKAHEKNDGCEEGFYTEKYYARILGSFVGYAAAIIIVLFIAAILIFIAR